MGREFRDIFTEGKDLAEQSEILEQTDVNPEEMYYGQGGDYEEEWNIVMNILAYQMCLFAYLLSATKQYYFSF